MLVFDACITPAQGTSVWIIAACGASVWPLLHDALVWISLKTNYLDNFWKRFWTTVAWNITFGHCTSSYMNFYAASLNTVVDDRLGKRFRDIFENHRGKHFGGLRYAVRKSTCRQTPQWWRLTFNCTSKVIGETFWMDKPGNLGWMVFPCHVEHLMWCKTLTWNDSAQRGWRSENPEQHECIYVNTYIFIIIWYNEI